MSSYSVVSVLSLRKGQQLIKNIYNSTLDKNATFCKQNRMAQNSAISHTQNSYQVGIVSSNINYPKINPNKALQGSCCSSTYTRKLTPEVASSARYAQSYTLITASIAILCTTQLMTSLLCLA
ncbi:hypothetical protein RND71_019291 [Anisodus tanguticus]|uniref:Uncharacterized protein n=1 Tax=Anisodus tanguticus TaxID=243964 RepID=A0AAE1VGB5_9SOLA|nr:hypothetical protein RND71_019291 [Anisodus tanguticus]